MGYTDNLDAYRDLSRKVREFEITETHLKLLRTACVDWNDCEFGAPSIDPKRPYGNSDVTRDIAEIVNPEIRDWDEDRIDRYLDGHYDRHLRLHIEIGVVLEICLLRGEFKAGRFRKVAWNRWEPVALADQAETWDGDQ